MEGIRTGWLSLLADSQPKCPKLFYRFTANEHYLEVFLTDLIGLWVSKSPVQKVYAYARHTRASIDPSADKTQLHVLFRKLAESLAVGENALRCDGSSEDETIFLKTKLVLKKPLRPLAWEFTLEAQGAGEMGETILRPCLHEASQSAHKIETLISMLEQKDRIITKLLEGIEHSISDLSLLFPGITGSRARKGQTTIEDAQRTVPALKPFSRALWSDAYPSQGPYSDFETEGLSKLVDGCEKCPKHTIAQHEKWVRKLPKATATASQVAQIHALRSSSPVRKDSNADSEIGFETQRRQSQLRQFEPDRSTGDGTDDETESGDEPAPPSHKDSPALESKSPLADEAIGSSPPPLPILPQPRETRQNSDSASSTASESSSDLDAPRTSKSKPRDLQPTTKHTQATRAGRATSRHSSSLPSPKVRKTTRQLSSSQPRPSQEQLSSRPGTSSSTASSADPQHNTRPPRLGRLGSSRISQSTTSQKAADTQSSAPPTPSRRLQRLGRGSSQASSRPQSRGSADTQPPGAPEPGINTPSKADDSDTSTASENSSAPAPAPQTAKKFPHALGQLKNSTSPTAGERAPPFPQNPEIPEEHLTKEEVTSRRREELKRKIGSGSANPTAGTTGAPRKKRKF